MEILSYVEELHSQCVIQNLLNRCKETFIVEFRLHLSDEQRLIDEQGQTLPTATYMKALLGKGGFELSKRFHMEHKWAIGTRQL